MLIKYSVLMLFDTSKAHLAQLVEQLIRNEQAGGSNPLMGSTEKTIKCRVLYIICILII